MSLFCSSAEGKNRSASGLVLCFWYHCDLINHASEEEGQFQRCHANWQIHSCCVVFCSFFEGVNGSKNAGAAVVFVFQLE